MAHVLQFPRVPDGHEPRRVADRRAVPRGGRRATDKPGFAPLVLILDNDADSNARCEAILARLHFAVAPTRTIDEARRVVEDLRPNIIVAGIAEAAELRRSHALDLPVIILSDTVKDPERLVDEIRRELRARHHRPQSC
jgi:hypothetical protein